MDANYNNPGKRIAHELMKGDGLETFDIPILTSHLKGKLELKGKGHSSITLVKAKSMRILLTALREGAVIAEHRTSAFSSIYILEGAIRLSTDGSSVSLKEAQLVTLAENIEHSVLAETDAVYLLTMTYPDKENKLPVRWFNTVKETIDVLKRRGYSYNFNEDKERIYRINKAKFKPEEFKIVDVYKVDDSGSCVSGSVMFVIESEKYNRKGYFLDACNAYSEGMVREFAMNTEVIHNEPV